MPYLVSEEYYKAKLHSVYKELTLLSMDKNKICKKCLVFPSCINPCEKAINYTINRKNKNKRRNENKKRNKK